MEHREKESTNNRSTFVDAGAGQSVHNLSVWGAVGDSGTWSGLNNWEITFYDPKKS